VRRRHTILVISLSRFTGGRRAEEPSNYTEEKEVRNPPIFSGFL
jgi:hypothetical protein